MGQSGLTEKVKHYLIKLQEFQITDSDETLEELDKLWLSMSETELDFIEIKLNLLNE